MYFNFLFSASFYRLGLSKVRVLTSVIFLIVISSAIPTIASKHTPARQTFDTDSIMGTAQYLEGVTVAARRPTSDIGIVTTAIDSTALRDNIAQSMADVLSFNSGVFVKSSGRATLSTVAFRGTAPSHTAVTWNGMPVNSPALGLTDFSMIPAYFIDRATLLHGSSSMTRTSAGLGGLVDLATSSVDIADGLSAQYVQGVGSFTTLDEFLHLAWGGEKWKFSTRAVLSTSDNDFEFTNNDRRELVYDDNYNVIDTYHPVDRNRNGSYADFHLLQQVYFIPTTRQSLDLNVWYTGSSRNIPLNTVDYVDTQGLIKKQRENTLRSILSWDGIFSSLKLGARAGYVHQWTAYDYAVERTPGALNRLITSRTSVNTAYLQLSADYSILNNLFLAASVDLKHDDVSTADYAALAGTNCYDKSRLDFDAAIRLRWQATDRLGLSAVVRQDGAGSDYAAPSPALFADYLLHRSTNLTLKGSVSRNHHFPTLNDLYFLPGGNPDLEPEHGFTYDIGASMSTSLSQHLSVHASANWFDSYINDWILWLPTNKGFFSPRNLKKVHAYGIEASAGMTLQATRDWLIDIDANLSWTRSINDGDPLSANDKSVGEQLPYVPELSASAVAQLSWRKWSLMYKLCFYSSRNTMTSTENAISGSLPSYYMNNVALERSFDLTPIDLSVKLAVNNIFDADYQTIMSHPMPGVNFELFFSISY